MFLWRFPTLAGLGMIAGLDMIEVFPLERAREAFEKMVAAKTHPHAVLRMSQ